MTRILSVLDLNFKRLIQALVSPVFKNVDIENNKTFSTNRELNILNERKITV